MQPTELVVRAIFLSGYAQRHHQIPVASAALLNRFNQILLKDYKAGQSSRAVNSLAYIQLHKLLEAL